MASELESDQQNTGTGIGWLILMLEKIIVSFAESINSVAVDVKMDGSVVEEKLPIKMMGLLRWEFLSP